MTTKEKIKEVALRLFAIKGYEETSLAMIAKEVGIKPPSIYAFYKSKEDLLLTIFHEVFEHHLQFIQEVTETVANESTETKLFKVLEGMYDYHIKEEEKTSFYRRFMLFPPAGLEEMIQEEFLKEDQMLTEILEGIFASSKDKQEVREIELGTLVSSYLCLMDGLFTQLFYYPRDPFSMEKRLKTNWEIYWAGIKEPSGVLPYIKESSL